MLKTIFFLHKKSSKYFVKIVFKINFFNLSDFITNVLVYFADSSEKVRHAKAKLFIDKIGKNPENFTVSMQNLREFAFVMGQKKRMQPDKIAKYLSAFQNIFQAIVQEDFDSIYYAALEFSHENTDFYDMLLAKTMQQNDIRKIYTENVKDFSCFNWLKVINPV